MVDAGSTEGAAGEEGVLEDGSVDDGMMVDEGDIQFVVQIHEIAAYGVLDTWIDAGMPSSHPKDLDRLHRLTRGSLEHALSNFDRRGEKRDTEA